MAEYKLTYFNSRGLAEPIRWIFAVAGVQYEDVRVEKEQWPELKPKYEWGHVPVLEVGGKQLSQSATIARFLAKKFKLTGADELEAAKCDELVDALGDLRKEWGRYHFESDETKKAEYKKALLEVHVPKYFGKFDSIIEANGGKWLVGQNVTWADLQVVSGVEQFETLFEPAILDKYPNVKKLRDAVMALPQIQEWVEKRPKTAM